MSESENRPVPYPQYDVNGNSNPVRVPPTEDSEQWELGIMHDNIMKDPNDPDSPVYRGHDY